MITPYEFVEILKQVENNKTMISIVDILLDKVDTIQPKDFCPLCQHCHEQ